MAVREARNSVKIEGWRLSKVPIDPTEVVFQGDCMVWDTVNNKATKATSGASAANFIGVSDTTNPIKTIGVLTVDPTEPRINVIQAGLVEMILGTPTVVKPFMTFVLAGDPQTVVQGSVNIIGFADMIYTAAGRSMNTGDLVQLWLQVPDTYRSFR